MVTLFSFQRSRCPIPPGVFRSLRSQIVTKKVRHVFEADIRGYFNHINHEWLIKMIKQRIADPVIIKMIGKWLKAGVMQNGVVWRNEKGTPQWFKLPYAKTLHPTV